MKNFFLTRKTKSDLLEFVTNWTQGVPGGSSFGEVARYICEVLEEAGMGDSACLISPIPVFPGIPAIPPIGVAELYLQIQFQSSLGKPGIAGMGGISGIPELRHDCRLSIRFSAS